MSIGPSKNSEKVELSKFDRLNYQAKKAVEEYFKKPIYYLFYGMLVLTILGLFIGMNFPWQYYFILIILAGIETYNFYSNAK